MKKLCVIFFTIVPALFPLRLFAHQTNSSYTSLTLTAQKVELILIFDLTDLERVFPLDANHDGLIEQDEILQAMPEMHEYFSGHLAFSLGYTPTTLAPREGKLSEDDFGNVFAEFAFSRALSGLPGEIGFSLDIFEKFGERHKNLAKIVHGEQVQQAIFTVEKPRQRFVIGGEVSLWAQLKEFTVLGLEHIFLGYDHIMFLFGLIVIGGRFLDLVKIVTSFTVAHSLTLILAALQIVALPPRLVESGIALSIAYVAAENFLIFAGSAGPQDESAAKHRWILTFFFGLVHGFGFANVLRDLGLPTKGLISSLLAFNVGVEIGQIVIAGLFFPLVLWITRTKFQRQVVFALSSVILVFGLSWFVERTFALKFMPF